MSVDANKAAARRFAEEVVGFGMLEVLEEVVAENATDQTRAIAGWAEGRKGFRQHVKWFRGVFPDLTMTVRDMVGEGDKVVWFWRAEGTAQETVFGVEPNGRRSYIDGVSWVVCQDDQIVSYDVMPDRAGFMDRATE